MRTGIVTALHFANVGLWCAKAMCENSVVALKKMPQRFT
jgi:protein tyrosine/serine phosphatase